MSRLVSLAAGLVGMLPTVALAEDFELHGFGDYRLVSPSDERSWTDGGLGKTRFGSGSGVEGRFGEVGLVGTYQILPDLQARADLQFTTTDRASLNLVEAYLRYRPVSTSRWRYSVKGGIFTPPVSMENQGIGWTSPWTLTPSAINSWVGEELLAVGTEGRLEWRGDRDRFEAGVAVFADDDPAGDVLASRGWSFSDLVYGFGSAVREPDVYAKRIGLTPPLRSYSNQEIDNRPGWYADITWNSREYGRVTFMRYDNEGDPTHYVQHGNGPETFAWRTTFWSLGATTEIDNVELAGQAMTGSTQVTPSPQFNSTTNFQAGYLLAAITFGAWQPAVRFDLFGTQQEPSNLATGRSEHGNAVTLALNWRPREWVRVTGEVLRVDSWRVQRVQERLSPATVDTQVQLAARFFF